MTTFLSLCAMLTVVPGLAAFAGWVPNLGWALLASTLLSLAFVVFAIFVIRGSVVRCQRAEQAVREQNALFERRVQERTAQLQTVLESLAEGVAVFHPDGSMLYFNRAALAMHGFASLEECVRKLPGFADLFEVTTLDGTLLPPAEWPVAKVLRGDKVHESELRIRHLHQGWERLLSCSGALAFDKDGGMLMAAVTMRDITERKLAEQQIRQQLEHLSLLDRITSAIAERQNLHSIFQGVVRSLEDSLPIDFACICLHDATYGTLLVAAVGAKSQALAHELALDEESVIEADAQGLARALEGHLVYEPEINVQGSSFAQRLARAGLRAVVMAPLKSENHVFGVLIAARRTAQGFNGAAREFLRQLSEHGALAAHQAQLYETLQQAYDDLRHSQVAVVQHERLRVLGQMASGIAHDVNNALSPVSLYTETLLETEPGLTTRGRDSLETIRRAVENVVHTVARMREFYRQDTARAEPVPVDLNALVRHCAERTEARWRDPAQRRGGEISLVIKLAPELPQIMGVESELGEALTDLVSNAEEAMPEGGTLTLRTRLSGAAVHGAGMKAVVLEVVDTGTGMDEETRRRCLEPFFTTKGERGNGLGLATVFGIAQRHDAEIQIDSAPGEGTTMRLLFAAAAVATTAAVVHGEATALSPLRLLLIDDDPILLKSLRETLEIDGHELVTADGGAAGIAAFRKSLEERLPFAAVFTDLGMPGMDGRAVAGAIKGMSPATPVILLTGWGQRLAAEGDIPAHVDRLMGKPPRLRELRDVLARLAARPDAGTPP